MGNNTFGGTGGGGIKNNLQCAEKMHKIKKMLQVFISHFYNNLNFFVCLFD